MQRPPSRKSPPILFGRPTHEWISRVDQKQKELVGLGLSADAKKRLDDWLDIEFVAATLGLEGLGVARERIVRLDGGLVDEREYSAADSSAVALLNSLRVVRTQTREQGKSARLTAELLTQLHRRGEQGVDVSDPGADRSEGNRTTSGEALSVACRWFVADSFVELHAVEQASIVLLRLLELRPFPEANERIALLGASLQALRCELPPIIVRKEKQAAYRSAIDEGFRMNTKPMVELIAEAIGTTISEIIERAK